MYKNHILDDNLSITVVRQMLFNVFKYMGNNNLLKHTNNINIKRFVIFI